MSSSLGHLYNWAWGHQEDMERDNEAIELQFVAGQRGPPPVGHCSKARRPSKEFKVYLWEWLRWRCYNVCHCLPATSTLLGECEWVKETLGLCAGTCCEKNMKLSLLMSESLWIMNVRHTCKLSWGSSYCWQPPLSWRIKKRKAQWKCVLLCAFCTSMYSMHTIETHCEQHLDHFWQSPIKFCHIIKAFIAVGSPTVPPTKPTKPLTNPHSWILPSSLQSLNHLASIHSHYRASADCDWKLSTYVTNRCYKVFWLLL